MFYDFGTIGFEIGKTMLLVVKELNKEFAKEGIDLTTEHFGLLNIINFKMDIIQQEIAEFTHKDKSSILRQIDSLEKKRYVVRLPDADDRRKKTIMLTKLGVDILKKALIAEENVMNRLKAGINPNDIEVFNKVIKLMQNNLT